MISRQNGNHNLWVKCVTYVEDYKLIYQSCSWLWAALGSSLIRDTDGSRYNGSIYYFGSMMIIMFLNEEIIHGLVIAKPWLPLIINIWPTTSNYSQVSINNKPWLPLTPHKASPPQPNGTFAEYVDVYSPLLSQNTRLPLVQSILR
jgi:hypothetical protein